MGTKSKSETRDDRMQVLEDRLTRVADEYLEQLRALADRTFSEAAARGAKEECARRYPELFLAEIPKGIRLMIREATEHFESQLWKDFDPNMLSNLIETKTQPWVDFSRARLRGLLLTIV